MSGAGEVNKGICGSFFLDPRLGVSRRSSDFPWRPWRRRAFQLRESGRGENMKDERQRDSKNLSSDLCMVRREGLIQPGVGDEQSWTGLKGD